MNPEIHKIRKGNTFRQAGRGLPLLLVLLLFASPAFAAGGAESISASEIMLYVGLIVGVILAAWLLNRLLTKKGPTTPTPHPPAKHHHHHHHAHHKHPRR